VDLSIIDILGDSLCIASEDGQKVHDAIAPELRAGREVRLSFRKAEFTTTAFLNAAIGQLYGEFTEEQIEAALTVCDASSDDLVIIGRVMARSKQYFKDPKPFEAAYREIWGEDDDL